MIENHIDFQSMKWERTQLGIQQKVYSSGNRKIRLVRFSEGFKEKDWCLKAHMGYVLDGELKIDFNGTIKSYKKGNGLCIQEGESSKHKAMIEKGKEVELILFEIEKD